MKRILMAAALLAAASATPAFAQSAGEKTGVNSALGIAPKTEDFIKEAAMSDMLEIEAAKVAQQKGDADDKKFADMMITDHTKTSSELKSLTPADLKGAIPASLDASYQKTAHPSRRDFLLNLKTPGSRTAGLKARRGRSSAHRALIKSLVSCDQGRKWARPAP